MRRGTETLNCDLSFMNVSHVWLAAPVLEVQLRSPEQGRPMCSVKDHTVRVPGAGGRVCVPAVLPAV